MKSMKLKTAILGAVLFGIVSEASPFEPIREEQVPAGDGYNLKLPTAKDVNEFKGKSVAILASHGVEEDEITFPYHFLVERGAQVEIVVPDWAEKGIVVSAFLKPTQFATADRTFTAALKENYDLLILTGGAWNAQVVRSDSTALKLISSHFKAGRTLAAICAGTSVLIDAGIAKGRKVTGSPVVKIDLVNAGGKFVDASLVEDGELLTSRTPNDLPDFMNGIASVLRSK